MEGGRLSRFLWRLKRKLNLPNRRRFNVLQGAQVKKIGYL